MQRDTIDHVSVYTLDEHVHYYESVLVFRVRPLAYLSDASQLHSLLSGHSVTGIEHSGCGESPEHGHILQTHLGWAILS